MRSLYLLSVYLHILATVLWLGGMMFLALIALPSLRRLEDAPTRARLLSEIGRRFRGVGWVAVGVLVLTGSLNAVGRWGWSTLTAPPFWSSEPGRLLSAKLVLVAVMVLLSAGHDFVLGPRVAALAASDPRDPQLARLRRGTVALARVELLLGLLVVALAVLIVRA
jgi:uncharacterized membrane protein